MNVRRWRGAFCIPGVDWFPGGRFWSPALLCYGEDVWQRAIDEYLRRKYTHLQILLWGAPYGSDYPWIEPDAGRAKALLQLAKSRGLATVVTPLFGAGDGRAHWEQVDFMLGDIQGLTDWVFPMYEMNTDLFGRPAVDTWNGSRWVGGLTDCIVQARERFPQSLIGVHFTPCHGSAGDDEPAWWRYVSGADTGHRIVDGLLSQDDKFSDPIGAGDGARSTYLRLKGKVGVEGVPAAWRGVDVDMCIFEVTTTRTYRNQMNEAEQVAYMTAMLSRCPDVAGFCDGGQA